jgi:hypothetical protein
MPVDSCLIEKRAEYNCLSLVDSKAPLYVYTAGNVMHFQLSREIFPSTINMSRPFAHHGVVKGWHSSAT